jgi:two-component system catabolic regulation response regulator CreB
MTGQSALEALAGADIALTILDIGLPDINGFELFKKLTAVSEAPVIFLTARAAEIDRVVGLELGADDYIPKPFSPRELTARVRSVLRRTQRAAASPGPEPGTAGALPFEIDEDRKRIAYFGKPLVLSRYEYRLLKVLVGRPGRVFSRQELMEHAWDAPDHSLERTVDAHIKTLRAKLRLITPERDPVKTHRGLGYSLEERW